MEKVRSLQRGSTLAVVSPSWEGPSLFPEVYELGISRLRHEFGFQIKEYPTTRADGASNQKDPEARAQDIISAFNDSEVRGIISSIGGDDAVRLLPFLDQHHLSPKFFMGYSDSTVLLSYFHQRGFCTFHGPSVMAGFAEPGKLSDEFVAHVRDFLLTPWEYYTYRPYTHWTDEPMEWGKSVSLTKERSYSTNTGWKILNPISNSCAEVKGILWGGCLEALEFIKGTKYWRSDEIFWKDKILFFELSDETKNPVQLEWILRNYGGQGAFTHARALLFGRFARVSTEEREALEQIVCKVVCGEYASSIPVIANVDFGHTYPQQIFPLGAEGKLTIVAEVVSLTIETPFTR